MGARGNSGVILSQIIRGAMEVLGQGGPVTCDVLARAFRHATETAYRAVRRPVEGTMLTVLREMAEAATAAPLSSDREVFMDEVVAAGWKSVERTPSLLRVLADAGVVDAGGYGLVVLVEGATNGRSRVGAAHRYSHRSNLPVAVADLTEEEGEEESDFTYCTSFLLTGEGLDQAFMEEELSRLGDSLLVVGDESRLKIHVHTDDPGRVLGLATSLGVLSEIEIDNMKEQTAARSGASGSGRAACAGRSRADAGGGRGRRGGQQDAVPQSGRRPHRRRRPVDEPLGRGPDPGGGQGDRSLGGHPSQQQQRDHDRRADGRTGREGSAGGAHSLDPGGSERGRRLRPETAGRRERPGDAGGHGGRRDRRGHPGGAGLARSTACR